MSGLEYRREVRRGRCSLIDDHRRRRTWAWPGQAPQFARGLHRPCAHDGYTDGLYAFLPIWQSQYRLSYAGLAVVRAIYYVTMGGLQLPADGLLRNVSPRTALVLATLIAAAGFALMALPFGFLGLCVGLLVAGIGVQHPASARIDLDTSLVVVNRFSSVVGRIVLSLASQDCATHAGEIEVPSL